jgi:hypothetical protein
LLEEFDGGVESGGVQGWFIKKGALAFWPDIPSGVERQIEISVARTARAGESSGGGLFQRFGLEVFGGLGDALGSAAEFHAAR